MTIGGALRAAVLQASGGESRREAELLMQAVTGLTRAGLLSYPERVLTQSEQTTFADLWQRRLHGEPIAYLLGWREFFGLRLSVSPAVLIPRAETELLVDAALARLPEADQACILDLGTGSGAIALALAAHRPRAEVHASDLSAAALAIAQANAQALGLSSVRFHLGHWFDAIDTASRFDLILSNPPYVAESDPHLQQGDLRFEPMIALTPGGDGLAPYRHLIDVARRYLRPGGCLLFEHGFEQAASIRALFAEADYEAIETLLDLESRERVTLAQWPGR